MTEEKILAFLNLDKDKKIDKFIMKLAFWFDMSFTLFIILSGLLFRVYSFSLLNISWFSIFIITDIAFYVWCRLSENPTQEFSFLSVVLTTSVFKLNFAFITFNAVRNGFFGWIHIIMGIVCIVFALYMIRKKYVILQDLKIHTIKQVQKNLSKKKNKMIIPISATSSIATAIFLLTRNRINISFEFCLWGLVCIWSYMAIISIFNYSIAKKYKVADVFSQDLKSQNDSIAD